MNKEIISLLNSAYWRLPWRWREPIVDFCYEVAGPMFRGVRHYENWSRRKAGLVSTLNASQDSHSSHSALLIDLKRMPTCDDGVPGRIAVHAHIYYSDLAQEFASHLDNMPYAYDLFVSVPDDVTLRRCEAIFSRLKRSGSVVFSVVPNRGRDIAPFIVNFGQELKEYDFIAHIHTKKSLYTRGKTDGWREYLLTCLFGSEKRIRQIFSLLKGEENIGMVYPQCFARAPYYANTWLANRGLAELWKDRLGIDRLPPGYFHFPVGSMFWAKASTLRPLFDAGIRLEDFAEECGQTDGTLAHCIERMLGLVPIKAGHRLAIVRDVESPSWSPWRFDQYLMRTVEQINSTIKSRDTLIVIFDIFDTLLVRPLLNPESVKRLVEHQAGPELGSAYRRWRSASEIEARQQAGKDIGLDAIYAEFAKRSKLSAQAVKFLRDLEERIEINSISARHEGIALYRLALTSSKRVVLASDMFLSKSVIESLLQQNGISEWHELYLSSDIGLRKDSGSLYHHLLMRENVEPASALMVGDNERSDLQIPADMGMRTLHIMRPVELARGLPRFSALIDSHMQKNDINDELAVGLLVKRACQSLSYSDFNPHNFVPLNAGAIGYFVVGPLLLAFVHWLIARAQQDKVSHLFFLAREGKILKSVYDRWASLIRNAPSSDYLVLSRRSVTVPMLKKMEDIYELARKDFFSNKIESFFESRYGITLSISEWNEIYDRGFWKKGEHLTIQDAQIAHLVPLLEYLAPKIFKQSEKEHPALIQYLRQKGMLERWKTAVVDVGYSGTIQAALNKLIDDDVHGYYLLTDSAIDKLILQHDVVAQGAYYHSAEAGINAPVMLRQSFILEKLLSSDDAQVVHYTLNQGDASATFAELSEDEKKSRSLRSEIHKGVDDYMNDALSIRGKLYSEFAPSIHHAAQVFSAFVTDMTNDEKEIVNGLSLDDHYCGRGVN